jgi:hypothetical protein
LGSSGLHLKIAERHPRLGEPPMLDGMSSRGPHRAGAALHDGDDAYRLRLSTTLYSYIGGLMACARATTAVADHAIVSEWEFGHSVTLL